ncbi:unnamed protein product, partial [Notodromas monacha]
MHAEVFSADGFEELGETRMRFVHQQFNSSAGVEASFPHVDARNKGIIFPAGSAKLDASHHHQRDPPAISRLKQDLFRKNLTAVDSLLRSVHDSTSGGLNASDSSSSLAKIKDEEEAAVAAAAVDAEGRPVLHLAVLSEDGHREATATKTILARGIPDVNQADSEGRTALHLAAGLGNVAAAEALVNAGADVAAKDNAGMTPLGRATAQCQVDVVAKLLEMMDEGTQADHILSLDNENWTAMHDAARNQCTSLVKLFLKYIPVERNEEIFRKSKNGWTALSLAARYGFPSIVRLLAARAPTMDDIYAGKSDGLNALHLAVWYGHKRTVEHILEATFGPLLSAESSSSSKTIRRTEYLARANSRGWNAFHFAVRYDFPAILELLIEQLDESEAAEMLVRTDDEGWSPLHVAARYGHVECMALLLSYAPGNVDALKEYGWTPLLLAVFAGHANATTMLVMQGANVSIVNDDGVDAALQAQHTCPQCLKALEISSAMRKQNLACDERVMNQLDEASSRMQLPPQLQQELSKQASPNPAKTSQSFGSSIQRSDPATSKTTSNVVVPVAIQLQQALLNNDMQTARAILNSTAAAGNPDALFGADAAVTEMPLLLLAIVTEGGPTEGITEALLNQGAPIDVLDNEGRTPLQLASLRNNLAAMKALIAAGDDIYAKDDRGHTPLMLATLGCGKPYKFGLPDLKDNPFSVLVEAAGKKGVEYILETDNNRHSAIHTAAFSSCTGAMEYFMTVIPEDRNEDFYRKNSDGLIPLSLAANNASAVMVKYLCQRAPGAEWLHIQSAEGVTPLMIAVSRGHPRPVQFIIEHTNRLVESQEEKIRLFALTNYQGWTAYHFAAETGTLPSEKSNIFFLILEQVEDTEREMEILLGKTNKALTPMHMAARAGKLAELMLLLTHAPGGLDLKTNVGTTPLMFATFTGNVAAASLLVLRGADIKLQDDEGVTALDLARDHCPECLPFFLEHIQPEFINGNHLCLAAHELAHGHSNTQEPQQPSTTTTTTTTVAPVISTTSSSGGGRRPAFQQQQQSSSTTTRPAQAGEEEEEEPEPDVPLFPQFSRPSSITSRPSSSLQRPGLVRPGAALQRPIRPPRPETRPAPSPVDEYDDLDLDRPAVMPTRRPALVPSPSAIPTRRPGLFTRPTTPSAAASGGQPQEGEEEEEFPDDDYDQQLPALLPGPGISSVNNNNNKQRPQQQQRPFFQLPDEDVSGGDFPSLLPNVPASGVTPAGAPPKRPFIPQQKRPSDDAENSRMDPFDLVPPIPSLSGILGFGKDQQKEKAKNPTDFGSSDDDLFNNDLNGGEFPSLLFNDDDNEDKDKTKNKGGASAAVGSQDNPAKPSGTNSQPPELEEANADGDGVFNGNNSPPSSSATSARPPQGTPNNAGGGGAAGFQQQQQATVSNPSANQRPPFVAGGGASNDWKAILSDSGIAGQNVLEIDG